ncbi:MAG: FAD-dependent oxidoreductase [Pikeienuella sp.]|uniref:NAD(P)/FAD-dependent oxidoreductase n=1 Tax=Pikeienuella sp. TaxID=2831957 RepID=UPI00391A06F5
MKSAAKKKIAVLGGGPSALVAAFRLTEEPGWNDRFEITVYQKGWRLGGKCATGRDLDRSNRLYEHGIHGFLGCYYNALTVMKRVFDSLERPADHPLPDFETAFHGMSGVIRYEMDEGAIKTWPIYCEPWWHRLDECLGREPTLSEIVSEAPNLARIDVWLLGLVRLAMLALRQAWAKTYRNAATAGYVLAHGEIPPGGGSPAVSDPASGRYDLRIEPGAKAMNAALGGLARAAQAAFDGKDFRLAAETFAKGHALFSGIASAGGGGAARDRLRRLGLLLDYFAVITRGVLADRVMKRGFAALDAEDHVDWLRRHGASEETIRSPLTSSTPNITYQYPEGDSLQPAVMAAGAYLHWTLMTFTYMGRFIQLFEAGSGETLIAPLHEALEKRGVRFAFFHDVKALRLAKGKAEIDRVEIDVQAKVKAGRYAYRPYVDVKTEVEGARPLPCWPDRPLWDQLEEGERLRASGADLESFWCDAVPAERRVLKRGEDFDEVILGVSVGALPFMTGDLAKRKRRWGRMLQESRTVMTQAMQLWLNETPWDLGWGGYTNAYDDYLLSANFMTQPNGQGDFTKYIRYEEWPEGHRPASLLLLCGTLPFHGTVDGTEGADFPARLTAEVKARSIQFLQATGGFMLEGATVAAQKGYGDPFAFDFDLLHPAAPEGAAPKRGAARFDDQYWRVNANPSDQYVSTPPGSTRWRLPAHDTGFPNLFIAGDWTENGLNVGSMEGSVRSGLLAAEAVLGIRREKSGVIGLDPRPPAP